MYRHLICMALVPVFLLACGDSRLINDSSGPGPDSELVDQALGGLWVGADGNNDSVVAYSDDAGNFRVVVAGEQGIGTASSFGSDIVVDYTFVPQLGSTLVDGSASAACSGSGVIQERSTLTISADCNTVDGLFFNTTAELAYDSVYNRDSDLLTIAGSYITANSDLYTIAGDGALFALDTATGCTINGQVSIIDAQFNLYDLTWNYTNCAPEFDEFNTVTLSGFALLDDAVTPEEIVFVLSGVIGGETVSVSFSLPRT